VFGLWRLDERRWLARVRYFYSLERATAGRPWRAALVEGFRRTACGGAGDTAATRAFARESPSGELARADLRLRDAARRLGISLDAASSDGSGTEASESSSDDGDPAELRARARARTARAKRVISAVVAERQAADLAGSASAALFAELAPTPRWIGELRRSINADDEGLSVFALMAGVFWPCSAVRARGGRPRRCACGYAGGDLAVHFCFGDAGDGAACTVAVGARAQWRKCVEATFAHYGSDARAAEAPSVALLAHWLGGGGRRGVDPDLAFYLPQIFCATLGRWAASERDAFAESMFPGAREPDGEASSDSE